MSHTACSIRFALVLALAILVSSTLPACGGGAAPGVDGEPVGQGLVLMEFRQAGQDNLPINRILEFTFSEPVDPSSVTNGSIQIREGPAFGLSAAGVIRISGSEVTFEPRLPTTCAKTDGAFKPGRRYRVTLLGSPEVTAVRNTQGQPLDRTRTFEFETLPDTDPDHLEDQRPGEAPAVTSTTPADQSAAVSVSADDVILVTLSESVDPCTVVEGDSIRTHVYELGDLDTFLDAPNGNRSGFDPVADAQPDDPTSWGGNATPLSTPVRLDVQVELDQDFDGTVLRLRPRTGGLPENSLVVVELTSQILDFGGQPLPHEVISFTTENLPRREAARVIEFDAETPIDTVQTTADVNTARSPDRAQAWLNFGGDGDNGGGDLARPSWPILDPGTSGFLQCGYQTNDGDLDAFDPTTDVTLNTGSTPLPESCTNESDGSAAVIWEFESFRIRSGVTVRLTGVNPGIILVRGDAVIESGGRLLLSGGDGVDSGAWNAGSTSASRAGGRGTAGGGDGGASISASQAMASTDKSLDGFAGFGSPDHDAVMSPGGPGQGGHGAGQGGSSSFPSGCNTTGGAQGGGGGGHAAGGGDAAATVPAGSAWDRTDVGRGGAQNQVDGRMMTPSAGSGGGGGGTESSTPGSDESSGGGGGAGGGFLCITANGDIRVFGLVDASGGRGGAGGWDPDGSCNGANSGGGGGGAGGGIRLLCAGDIDVANGTLTAAGGPAGPSGAISGPVAGPGATGRIVLEDGDSIISGMGTALVVPGEGQTGFYRGMLDTTRFVSGATESRVTTQPMPLGSILRPDLVTFPSLTGDDFVAGIPSVAAMPGEAGIIIEVQGFLATPAGDLDPSTATGWYTAGYFSDNGNPNAPAWHADVAPPDFLPEAGAGIGNLDGRAAFVQVRVTFRLPATLLPDDPGPFVDRLTVCYSTDS